MSIQFQSLSAIFEKRIFRIPDYQRGYAWEERQLQDFWEDLYNLRSGSIHYTGALSLQKMEAASVCSSDKWLVDKENYRPFYVIDGQQRLTTAFVLLREIVEFVASLPENEGKSREQIKLNGESLRSIENKYLRCRRPGLGDFSYLLDYDNKEGESALASYMKHKLFEEAGGGEIQESYYTQKLGEAKQFFHRKLAELYGEKGEESINDIYHTLIKGFTFSLLEFDNNYNAFITFETLNDRGKALSNLELLKNRLIYLSTLFDDEILDEGGKVKLRHEINSAWREIYYQLGRNKKALSDDGFLRDHSALYFLNGADNYIGKLLKHFSSGNIISDMAEYEKFDNSGSSKKWIYPKDIRDYVLCLRDVVPVWYASFFPEEGGFSFEETEWLEKLNRIRGIDNFRPLLVSVLLRKAKISEEQRIELYKALERFMFIIFYMGHWRNDYKKKDFWRKAHEIYDAEGVNAQEDRSPIEQAIGDLEYWCDGDEDWEGGDVAWAITVLQEEMARDGWYSWRGLRYFLFEYERYLAQQYGRSPKISWKAFIKEQSDRITIEHILPQTPEDADGYWEAQFKGFWAKKKKLEKLTHSLGNLLPLSQRINSSLQNDAFPKKKEAKRAGRVRGYAKGSFSELEVAENKNWTAEKIKKRGIKMLEFMNERWKLSMSHTQIKELLGLDKVC